MLGKVNMDRYDPISGEDWYATVKERIAVLEDALRESLKLQAHYARLLNDYDGGQRLIFESMEAWIRRSNNVR